MEGGKVLVVLPFVVFPSFLSGLGVKLQVRSPQFGKGRLLPGGLAFCGGVSPLVACGGKSAGFLPGRLYAHFGKLADEQVGRPAGGSAGPVERLGGGADDQRQVVATIVVIDDPAGRRRGQFVDCGNCEVEPRLLCVPLDHLRTSGAKCATFCATLPVCFR